MRVIKEYRLNKDCVSTQTIYLPRGAEPLAVRNTPSGLLLQAMSDFAETETELRTFKICSVEENIYVDAINYIDNFESSTGIRHVLEFV